MGWARGRSEHVFVFLGEAELDRHVHTRVERKATPFCLKMEIEYEIKADERQKSLNIT